MIFYTLRPIVYCSVSSNLRPRALVCEYQFNSAVVAKLLTSSARRLAKCNSCIPCACNRFVKRLWTHLWTRRIKLNNTYTFWLLDKTNTIYIGNKITVKKWNLYIKIFMQNKLIINRIFQLHYLSVTTFLVIATELNWYSLTDTFQF